MGEYATKKKIWNSHCRQQMYYLHKFESFNILSWLGESEASPIPMSLCALNGLGE